MLTNRDEAPTFPITTNEIQTANTILKKTTVPDTTATKVEPTMI